MPWTNYYLLTGLIGIWLGMIIPIFDCRSPKGRGNQLNFGHVCRWLVALSFANWLADREADIQRLDGSNLYKFVELPCNNLGVYAVKTRNFCRDSAAIDDIKIRFILHFAFRNWWNIAFLFHMSNQKTFLCILWKFGEIRISDPGV